MAAMKILSEYSSDNVEFQESLVGSPSILTFHGVAKLMTLDVPLNNDTPGLCEPQRILFWHEGFLA
jgi:hypothetical protein